MIDEQTTATNPLKPDLEPQTPATAPDDFVHPPPPVRRIVVDQPPHGRRGTRAVGDESGVGQRLVHGQRLAAAVTALVGSRRTNMSTRKFSPIAITSSTTAAA